MRAEGLQVGCHLQPSSAQHEPSIFLSTFPLCQRLSRQTVLKDDLGLRMAEAGA